MASEKERRVQQQQQYNENLPVAQAYPLTDFPSAPQVQYLQPFPPPQPQYGYGPPQQLQQQYQQPGAYPQSQPGPPPLPMSPLQVFGNRYEIKPQYLPIVAGLARYRSILICDDSGSMNSRADPDTNRYFPNHHIPYSIFIRCYGRHHASGILVASLTNIFYPYIDDIHTHSPLTRWQELIQIVQICIEGHAAVGSYCDVYFINRAGMRNITQWGQIEPLFRPAPTGMTNLTASFQRIEQAEINGDMTRDVIIHILTDGHPTDVYGNENLRQFGSAILNRRFAMRTLISIVLCTDEEEIERMYRQIQLTLNCDMAGSCDGHDPYCTLRCTFVYILFNKSSDTFLLIIAV